MPEQTASNDSAPASHLGRRLATVLAGLLTLTVAGGWAYDHRAEYGIAYAQLFDEASDICARCSAGTPTVATTDESPACCHADGTCTLQTDLTALIPVEAPKPAAAVAEVLAAPKPLATSL